MAERRGAGLTFGQLITLTFGFLLASLFIFVFGFWVGHDLAEQRSLRQRQALRVPLAAVPTAAAAPAQLAAAPATRVPPVATATAVRPIATATAVQVVRATATPQRVAARSPTPVAAGNFTVQAYATNDTMRAIMLARTLRAKGYDATTGEKKVGGVTWYTVRVGRFRDRGSAKAMESKLRDVEGLEAASVVAQ